MKRLPDSNEPLADRTRAHASIRRNYNRLATWYDALSGEKEHRLSRDLVECMAVPRDGWVMDLGCGTGRSIQDLALRMAEGGRIIGLDLSEKMCAITQKRIHRLNAGQRVMVVNGDACAVPLANDSLDAILMSFSLEVFSDSEMKMVIKDCLRVLKVGGKLGIVSMAVANNHGIADQLYEQAHRWLPGLVDCRPLRLEQILNESEGRVESVRYFTLWGLSVRQGILVKTTINT